MATFNTPAITRTPDDASVSQAEREGFMAALGAADDNKTAHKDTGNAETINRVWTFNQVPLVTADPTSANHVARKSWIDGLITTVNNAITALSNTCVKLTGTQTISGTKTFSSFINYATIPANPSSNQVPRMSDVDNAILSAVVLNKKVISIGDWNMNSTSAITVAHGLDFTKIRSIDAFVRSDSDAVIVGVYPLGSSNISTDGLSNGLIVAGQTHALLSRRESGMFQDTAFDATPYNRGWIIIEYAS